MTNDHDDATGVYGELAPLAPRLPGRPGRPSTYTPELANTILTRYAAGEPIKSICADEAMPAHSTYCKWKWEREDFRAALARARADKAEVLAERPQELLAAVDTDSPYGSARVALAREKVNYNLWLAGKLDRDAYGDSLKVDAKISAVQVIAFADMAPKVRVGEVIEEVELPHTVTPDAPSPMG